MGDIPLITEWCKGFKEQTGQRVDPHNAPMHPMIEDLMAQVKANALVVEALAKEVFDLRADLVAYSLGVHGKIDALEAAMQKKAKK